MQPTLRLFATAAVAFAFASVSLRGQATSQIQGIIKDPSGGAVAGAQIKSTQTQTNEVHTFTSDAEGNYIFLSLPIGPYKIEAAKTGFTTFVQTDIELQVVSGRTVNFSLQVSATPQIVTVSADATRVETRTTSIGTVVENNRINELPLNGRNSMELVQIAGSAVPAGKNNTNGYPGGLNIAIAGGQLYGISYQLDGTMYGNLLDATNLPIPFPDALQEFKVETSTMTAQNGTHASGAVSASIKSGTNQFHGDLFEFFRNGEMNARNTIASRSDTLKRNQFGGTIGGPIVKNKVFFFAGYQGTRTRSDPLDSPPANVPTAQMLSGDFSGCPSFPATIRDPTGGTFPNKQIPVTRFSSQALKVVDFLPKSSDAACGKVSFGSIIKSNEHQVLGRIDYSINSKHQIFGRYMASAFAQPPSYGLSGNILATGNSDSGGLDDLAQTAALGYTYLASPNVINQFRLAFNRVAVRRFTTDYFSGCDIGVNMYCYVPNPIINVTGGFTIGSNPASQGSFIPTYLTFSDDLSVVRGAHAFAFGYSSFKLQHSQNTTVNTAIFFFNATGGTGFGPTDFLLGQVGRMTQSTPATVFTNKWGHGLYAQDTWRITRRLTLNYGVRWEPFLPQALNNGAVYNFSLDAFKAGARSQVRTNAPAGLSYPGDPGFQGKTGVNKRWNQFAPRVGIAFDPRGNGMTSIRASAGIAYDFPNLQIMSDPTMAPPFASLINTNGPVPFGDPYRGANPYPVVPDSFVPFGTYIAQQPDAKVPTTYTWNFSVQHQIGRDWLVSASYAGSQSAHLWVTRQLNPAVLVPGPIDSSCVATATNCNSVNNTNRRRLTYLANPAAPVPLGAVDMFDSSGNSNYHGLILSTQKRFNQGVSFNANYTWSHCIGDMVMGSGPGNGSAGVNGVNIGGPGGSYSDGNDRRRDRGNCGASTIAGLQALDRRHIFNFTTVLEVPRFQDRVLKRIASDWKLSSSYRFLSASFLSATNGGTDVALTGAAGQRANQLLDNVYCTTRSANCWINPAAFAIPPAGTVGNAGRSNIEGPGFFGLDMALSRIFRFDSGVSLEARGEAFNLTNSVRLNAPVTARNDNGGNFGKILTAQDPRILQVALKLVF